MKIDTYIALRKQRLLILMNFNIIFILFISNFHSTFCQKIIDIFNTTPVVLSKFIIPIHNETYFNNIKEFDKKKYQVGNFATNKNGNLILELYENTETTSKRLFFGLTKEGSYLFSDEPSYIHEKIVESSSNSERLIDLKRKSNSFNLFVSIENKSNEYLLALNTYNSWIEVELYDLNNNNEYYKWDFKNFFDFGDNIDNYEFSLFELKQTSSYFIVSIPKFYITESFSGNKFIKEFNFKFLNNNVKYNELKNINYENFVNSKIINAFYMDDCEIIVVFFAKNLLGFEGENITTGQGQTGGGEGDAQPHVIGQETMRRRIEIYGSYNFMLYDQNLIISSCQKTFVFPFEDSQLLYLKSIYLGRNYTIFSYIYNTNAQLIFFHLIEIEKNDVVISVKEINKIHETLFNFHINETLSDLIKMDDRQIIFIYAGSYSLKYSNNANLISIIILDINPDDSFALSTRVYNIDLRNLKPILQLSAFCYDGYLLLATTVTEENSINNNIDYYSLLIMFGYSKGINKTIDISYYLSDNENYGKNSKTLFDILYENFTLDNNIFNYTLADKIKLIFIPQEIIIININSNEAVNNDSEINSYNNYSLYQNLNMTKNSQYYYIDYQYIIKDKIPQHDKERIFYSRTNRLYFKLCFEYCETCNELGISEYNTKCLSCLPDYDCVLKEYNENFTSTSFLADSTILSDIQFNAMTTNILNIETTNYETYEIETEFELLKENNINNEEENEAEIETENENKENTINIEYKTSYEMINYTIEVNQTHIKNFDNSENIYNNIKNELMTNYDKTKDNFKNRN